MAAERSINSLKPIETARSDFPILSTEMNGQPLAFLDSAASAQKPNAVMDVMNTVMQGGYANIHRGLYALSQDLTTKFEDVREKVARFINAPSEKEIIFTRNTTEAMNLFAQSYGRAHLQKGDDVIITEMEHHANIVPWQILKDQIGINIKIWPVDNSGDLILDDLDALLSEKTKIVSFVHVSNALGTVNPVKIIVDKVKKFNPQIVVAIDGTQSTVHAKVDVQDLGCDFFAFTAHKLYGPTGIGVLYGRMAILEDMPPYQGGGDMIDHVSFEKTTFKEPPFRFEAGTPPIVEAIGLGAAIDYMESIGMDAIESHEAQLLQTATQMMQNLGGFDFYGTSQNKAAVLSFNLQGAHASDVGMILDQCGVAVRTGHHCCMPLMQRYGVDATVRASFGLYSNEDDVQRLEYGLKKAKDMLS